MAPTTAFTTATVKSLLARYDCGTLRSWKRFRKGMVQSNLSITTTKGRYALRYYETRSEEYVRFELDVLNHLSARGYPTPVPISAKDGEALQEWQGKPFVLSSFVPGQHRYHLNAKQYASLMRHLAWLHDLTEGYLPKESRRRERRDPAYCRATAKQEAKKCTSKATAKGRLAFIESELASLRFPKGLPRGVVHGDYDLANIKFTKDEVSGVLDFDDACSTILLFDLASVVYHWCWVRENTLRFAKAKRLLEEYACYRPFTLMERKHLFDALKLVLLIHAAWFLHERLGKIDVFEDSKGRLLFLDRVGREGFEREDCL